MSKQQGGDFHIPLPIIIFGDILSPPVGVVLTLLQIMSGGKDKSGKTKTGQTVSKEVPVKEAAGEQKQTGKRSGISVPALVLGILAAIFLFCAVINVAEALFAGMFSQLLQGGILGDSLILLLFSAACFIPACHFKKQHDRRSVIRSIIGRRETIQLTQLAAASDLSPKKLRKELQAMINQGEFGEEAYIDLASGRFMRHPDEMEEMLRQETEKSSKKTAHADSEEIMESDQFRSIILQIRKRNDDIKDYAVSERIYRIEEHTQNIFDYVTQHPEAMSQIRTFMNYYLPTTLKLLDSYSRIEQVGVAGENMKKSKENIERILDMLVVGFEQQVDKLFSNESLDISSEIKVLETMMKQDGLDGRSDFDPGYTDDLKDGGSAAAQSQPETE